MKKARMPLTRTGTRHGAGLFAAAAVIASQALAQVDAPTLVTESQARCISLHADDYIAEDQPVYIVVLPPEDSCPGQPADTTSLADNTEASGVGIGLVDGDSSGFMVMTRAQIVCVKQNLADILEAQPNVPGKFRFVLEKCPE